MGKTLFMQRSSRRTLPAFALTRLVACGAVFGQSQPDPAAVAALQAPITDEEFHLALEPDLAVKVDEALPLLSAPDFKQREQATEALIGVGPPAFAKLRQVYHASDDLETRTRIERVVRSAYLNYYVLDRYGFLGVRLAPVGAIPNEPKLPDGVIGIRVDQVIPNTGAARSGLKEQDVVIAVDEVPLEDLGINSVAKFSEGIRSRRPGATMRLTVLRHGQQIELEAIVGRAAQDVAVRNNVQVTSQLAAMAAERFEVWWHKFFNPPQKTTGARDLERHLPRVPP